MKKTIFIILLLATAFSITAQNISIGPTAGFGHSLVTHIDDYSYTNGSRKFDPAWNAGLSFVYSIKKIFGLGIDIKYSAEGNKEHIPGFFGGDVISPAGTAIYHLNYVRVPVKFIYFFGKTESTLRPKIYIGPDFGFLIKNKNVFKVDGGDTFKMDVKDQVKDFDFGSIIAVGLNYRIKHNIWLSTDAAWYQGMTDVLKDYSPANKIIGRNGNIKLNIGLLLGLKK